MIDNFKELFYYIKSDYKLGGIKEVLTMFVPSVKEAFRLW